MPGTTQHTPVPSPDLADWRIAANEVAALAGVQRPVVTNWARRHPDFPAPAASADGRRSYSGRAVVDWLLDTGHGNADPRHLRAELALHTLNAWQGALPAGVFVDTLTALICLHQQYDRPVSAPDWTAVLDRAAELDADDTFLLGELRSVPPHLGPALAALADQLVDAAYTPAEAQAWVLDARRRLGANEATADEPSPAVTRALALISGIGALAEGSTVVVDDARAGALLAALHEAAGADSGHTYLASEPDPRLARQARRRMLTRGVFEFQLHVADGEESSVEDFGDPDLVVRILPYESAETRDPVAVLERVQACTDLLADGATAVVLGPADALAGPLPAHGAADRLRRSFLTEGLLKAAVNLPGGAFPYRPAYRTAIWVLARTPLAERRGLVLLADYSAQPLTEEPLKGLADDLGIWRAAGWVEDAGHALRHAVVVPAKVLDDHPGTAFTPQHRALASRYGQDVIDRPARIGDLEVRLEALAADAARATAETSPLRTGAVLRPADQPVPRTTVRRLVKAKRLRVLPGHRIAADRLTADGHYPVLGREELTGTAPVGSRRIDRGLLLTAYEHVEFTEPGDIVVTAAPAFGAYVDDEGLSVVVYPAKVLRVRTDTARPLQPRVLAALLTAAAAEHPRAPGAVRASRAVEDLPIPDLDPDEAARFAALLDDVAQRREALKRQAEALEDLQHTTAAGINDGTLAIDRPAETTRPRSPDR